MSEGKDGQDRAELTHPIIERLRARSTHIDAAIGVDRGKISMGHAIARLRFLASERERIKIRLIEIDASIQAITEAIGARRETP